MTTLKKLFFLLLFVLIGFICIAFTAATKSFALANPVAYLIQLDDDTINPVTAEYITKSIDRAEFDNAKLLIIKLDTPGGLLSSTRLIVKHILSAKIPVVVYISPSGSRAGSAGVFITYASHIAAMAPSTNIGAAHPVEMGGGKEEKNDFWDELRDLISKSGKYKEGVQAENPSTSKSPASVEASKNNEKKLESTESNGQSNNKQEDNPDNSTNDGISEDDDPMSSKILNDTVAFIKAIAKKRNRNIEWGIESVAKSSSITETEAVNLNVVEIIAQNEEDLLKKLDGRQVEINDQTITLDTKNMTITRIDMDFRQKFFNILANPNIAYILMILGFYGLLYEVTHPGFGVPGVLGTIFLILAFYSMQTLPTNYAALALIILGLVLFIAEAFVPGFGLLTLGGIVCTILGSLLLFDSSSPIMKLSIPLILSFTLTTAAIAIFLLGNIIRAHGKKITSGIEGMIGLEGEVYNKIILGKEGKIFVHGELWNAISEQIIEKGEKVIVEEVHGLKLKVKKAE